MAGFLISKIAPIAALLHFYNEASYHKTAQFVRTAYLLYTLSPPDQILVKMT